MNGKSVKFPCRGCVYFHACGENTRREPCAGRKTKTEDRKTNDHSGKSAPTVKSK